MKRLTKIKTVIYQEIYKLEGRKMSSQDLAFTQRKIKALRIVLQLLKEQKDYDNLPKREQKPKVKHLSKMKPVIQLNERGVVMREFMSVSEAAKSNGINISAVSRAISKGSDKVSKWNFKYK